MTKQVYVPRRKARKSGTAASNQIGINSSSTDSNKKIECAEDPLHCGDTPFCQLLCELAKDIFPIKDTSPQPKEYSAKSCMRDPSVIGLATLFRDYLVTDRLNQQQAALNSSVSSKKKRKKKKKRPNKSEESFSEDNIDSKVNESSSEPQQGTNGKEKDSSVSVDVSNHSSSVTSRTLCDSRMKMLERFLDDMIPSVDASAGNASSKNTLTNFLEAVISKQGETRSSYLNKNMRNKLSTSSAATQSEYSCHVHFSQAQAALQAIACPTCRGAVRKVFTSDFCLEVRTPIVGNDSENSDFDDEKAFDYVAMEEGVMPVNKPEDREELVFQMVALRSNGYEIGTQLGASSGWHLRRKRLSDPVNSKLSASSWNVEDIQFMIKYYVVLSGFHPDILAGATRLADDVIESLVSNVDSRVSNITSEFRNIATDLSAQVEKFVFQQGADQTNARLGMFDMRSFPIMLDTDNMCCQVIERVMAVVLDMTRTVQHLVAHHAATMKSSVDDELYEACKWIVEPCKQLWKAFWGGVTSCAENIEKYEQQLFALGDRLGNLPAMYLNSTSRTVYRTLVENNVRVVHGIITSVEKIMLQQATVDSPGCEGWSTTFMRKAFTFEAFSKVLLSQDEGKHDEIHSACNDSQLDMKFRDVMKYVSSTWTKSVHNGNSNRIISAHKSEKSELSVLIKDLREHCITVAGNRHSENLIQNIDFTLLKLDKQILDGEEHADSRSFFCRRMIQFASDWILCGVNCSSQTSHLNSRSLEAVMPLKLKQSMVTPNGLSGSLQSFSGHERCDGSNGKLRAVGVLVGLFLKHWLLDRYREWHARVTEEELLTTIAGETKSAEQRAVTDDAECASKQGITMKKSKKKKAKKSCGESVASVSDNEQDNEGRTFELKSLHNGNSQSGSLTLSKGLENNDLKIEESRKQATDTIDLEEVGCGTNPLGLGEKVDTMRSEKCGLCPENENSNISPELLPGEAASKSKHCVEIDDSLDINNDSKVVFHQQFSVHDVEEQVNVLVYTKSGFQSAEKFLLDRFVSILQ